MEKVRDDKGFCLLLLTTEVSAASARTEEAPRHMSDGSDLEVGRARFECESEEEEEESDEDSQHEVSPKRVDVPITRYL